MESKQYRILRLFFEYPSRQWHFNRLVESSGMARSKVNRWLKEFVRSGIIRRIKEKGRHPYYIADHDSSTYRSAKRAFAFEALHSSGVLAHLMSLEDAKSVILFGSFSRSDWYHGSDVDIFVYGGASGLDEGFLKKALDRDVQVFECGPKELARFSSGFFRNLVKGILIKGNLDFLKVIPDV